MNSVNSVFLNAEKNQGKPATKKQTSIRPNIKIFIFISLTNEEFFNQNPTKRYLLKYNCNTNQQPFINTKDYFLSIYVYVLEISLGHKSLKLIINLLSCEKSSHGHVSYHAS